MQPDTDQNQHRNVGTYLWVAGAVGAAAGIATLAYRRSRETAWEKTRRRTLQVAETARKEVKPWMGVAASAAVGGAGLAYTLRRKPTGWEAAQRRAGKVAGQWNGAIQPWVNLAATAALSAIALTHNRRQQQKAGEAIMETAGATADKLAETGARLIQRVQQISGETRKLYPSLKRLIA
jgi:hypothetical protein